MANILVFNQCVVPIPAVALKVVNGTIRGTGLFPKCVVEVADGDSYKGVLYLTIEHQLYTKDDLKHLIKHLTDIHEVL